MKSTITSLTILITLFLASFLAVSHGTTAFAVTHSYGYDLPDPNGGGLYVGTNDVTIRNGPLFDAFNNPIPTEFLMPDTSYNGMGWNGSYSTTDNNIINMATMIRFDGLSIPAGSTINSVTLSLFKVADHQWLDDDNADPRNGPGFTINAAGVMAPWNEANQSFADEQMKDAFGDQWLDGGPTRNHRLRPDSLSPGGFTEWNEPFALAEAPDYSASSYDSVYDRGPVDGSHFFAADQGPVEGYFDIDVTSTFADQFDKGKLNGWILHTTLGPPESEEDPGATDGRISWRDWEVHGQLPTDTSPILVVDFTAPGGGTLAGDYNGNDTVDAADYTAWLDNLGASAGALPNDTDGGVIGQAQYDTWKANFGATAGSGTTSGGAVPEPTSVMLLLMGALSFALTSRRSR